MQHAVAILFVFAFGACVGSFLNVVVWRLPRGESLSHPPSHCPKCQQRLKWYDNLPVIGWLKLLGKCRFCRSPISIRYPLVETATGAMFVFYYVMFFITDTGPCVGAGYTPQLSIGDHWPIYGLYMLTASALLAASLIDAETFTIPIQIPYFIAIAAVVVHPIIDTPAMPGNLIVGPLASAIALGGGLGLLVTLLLVRLKRLPLSFPEGEVLEADRPFYEEQIAQAKAAGQTPPVMPELLTGPALRREIVKEVLFLLPPVVGAIVAATIVSLNPTIATLWQSLLVYSPVASLFGVILGALVGGFVVWAVRILATLGFGRIAMGLGDVHLMFGVGAALGAGQATVAFFLAPFAGIGFALYRLISGKGREVPYGPFLSFGAAGVMLFYCPIADYLRPGFEGLLQIVRGGW